MTLQVKRDAASLRFQIERNIRFAIVSGRFKPGDRLIERELCELLNASRSSVREALRRLEAEELITNVPYRGPVVAGLTIEQARQLYEVREHLERIAARDFTRMADDAAIGRLEQSLQGLERAVARDSSVEMLEASDAFYTVLLEHSGNHIVRQLMLPLFNRIALLRATSMSSPGRAAHSMRELRAILKAIEARNPQAAAEAAAKHVRRASQAAVAVLEQRERKAPAETRRGRELRNYRRPA
jgi:DNA-binding GntR family transcriptional regulator